MDLNRRATQGLSALNEAVPGLKNEFLKEAVSLVGQGVIKQREIRTALEQRISTMEGTMYEANMFRSIGKFPPAFGLLATT